MPRRYGNQVNMLMCPESAPESGGQAQAPACASRREWATICPRLGSASRRRDRGPLLWGPDHDAGSRPARRRESAMKRLSMLDAAFLYLETPETPMHVGSVSTFKPSGRQENLFERFREHTAARLDVLPSYRRRLEATPFGLGHPVWVVDDKLDLDHHIRRHALPKPGGMAELRALIAQLHAVPLDRSRPLWEYHFIEGLEDGGFAVYLKVHHSTMDALAGMATLGVTYDFDPGAEHEGLPQRIVPPDVEPFDAIELTSTAIGDFIRQGWRAVTSLPGVARALMKVAPHFGRDARFLYSYVKDMPRTPLNTAISGHRVYATSSLPLHDVRALAKSRGVTINDVVLALCAGALRRYLVEHAALPEKPLT